MDYKIIAVGKIRDHLLKEKIEEYAERIRHDAKLDIVELRDATVEEEGDRILKAIEKERAHIVALDETGRLFGSVPFARRFTTMTKRVVFIVGGHRGLSDRVKGAAHELLSLSPLTFTHELARLLIAEQLYRAVSIVKNRAYHKH